MALNIYALGHRVHVIRKNRGFSQNQLSELINKSPTYLSYIENGSKCMSLDTFVDLSNALGVTADELLRDSLENTIIMISNDLTDVIEDCSEYEQRVLLEIIVAAKKSLRTNRSFFSRKRR